MNHLTASGRLRAVSLVVVASLLAVLSATGTSSSALPGQTAPTQPTQPTTQDDGDNPQLSSKYNDVLREEAKLQKELDTAHKAAQDATDKLDVLQLQTRQTQIELLGAQADLRNATTVARLREKARRQAERRADRALDRLRAQAVASYVRGGNSSLLEAVLAARNGQEAGQALAYGNAAVGDTDALLRTLRKARDLERRQARAAAKARADAATHRQKIEDATKLLVTARDTQKKLVALVDLKLAAVNKNLKIVQTRKLLVQGELDGGGGAGGGIGSILAGLQADQPDYQLGAVDIADPIDGGKVSSKFGIRFHPVLHVYRLHAGCDIGSPVGTPIHAAADGIVVMAQVTGGYGNATVIDHGNSLATLYGHQSKILVTPGQLVKQGDVIGLVGNTGLSTGPHLHFETRIKGSPVNPEGIVDFTRNASDPRPTTTTTPN